MSVKRPSSELGPYKGEPTVSRQLCQLRPRRIHLNLVAGGIVEESSEDGYAPHAQVDTANGSMQNAKLSFHTVPPAECIPMRVWIPGTLVALTPERKAGSLPMQCGSAGGWTDKHLPRAEETHMLCKCSSRLPTLARIQCATRPLSSATIVLPDWASRGSVASVPHQVSDRAGSSAHCDSWEQFSFKFPSTLKL